MKRYTRQEIIFAAGLPVVWLILNFVFFRFHLASVGFILISVLLLMVEGAFILFPGQYKRLFAGWMYLAHKIAWVNTMLILALLFYLIFAPIGLILRLLRKDLLNKRLEPGSETYWSPRSAGEQTLDSYQKMF